MEKTLWTIEKLISNYDTSSQQYFNQIGLTIFQLRSDNKIEYIKKKYINMSKEMVLWNLNYNIFIKF